MFRALKEKGKAGRGKARREAAARRSERKSKMNGTPSSRSLPATLEDYQQEENYNNDFNPRVHATNYHPKEVIHQEEESDSTDKSSAESIVLVDDDMMCMGDNDKSSNLETKNFLQYKESRNESGNNTYLSIEEKSKTSGPGKCPFHHGNKRAPDDVSVDESSSSDDAEGLSCPVSYQRSATVEPIKDTPRHKTVTTNGKYSSHSSKSAGSTISNESEECWDDDDNFNVDALTDTVSQPKAFHSSCSHIASTSKTISRTSNSKTAGPNTVNSMSSSSSIVKKRTTREFFLEAARRQQLSVRFLEMKARNLFSNSTLRTLRLESSKKSSSSSCPFFVGASDTNAHLFASWAESTGGSSKAGFYDTSVQLVEDETDEGDPIFREEILVDFSYTKVNPEFPFSIKESDLFDNPTTDGFVTREYGFMIPNYEQTLQDLLEHRGRIWYAMGERMEGLMASNRLLSAIDEMEIVEGDEKACPDGSLQIAASLLAYLTYGYRASCWRNNITYTPCPALQIPFSKISERLGRKDVYFSPEDFMYNQRPLRGNVYEFDNLELMSPLYGTAAEDLMSKLFCESNRYLYQMQDSILALCRGEWNARHIHVLITQVKLLTKMFGRAIPDISAGKSSIDPIECAIAFANSTAPFKSGVPALSGSGCPVFIILDLIIGRKHWNSSMAKDTLMQAAWMPKNWRRYIEYIRQARLFEKVPPELRYLWQLLKDVYCGERGWLGKHKYRAYQFVELAGALGKASTNKGDFSGSAIIDMLEEARRERDGSTPDDRSSYKLCNFKGTIKSVNYVSEDRTTKLVTIESKYPIAMHEGDHVAIVMKNSDDNIWKFSSERGLNLREELRSSNGTLTKDWKDRLDFENLKYNVYNILMCAKLRDAAAQTDLTVTNICNTLVPEEPRLYSFATVHPSSREVDGSVNSFDLLVTRTGAGGCSAFLFESVGQEVSFGLSTAVNCDLPNVTTKPLVVIAAGSGLGTYLPLLVNRKIENPKYAFLAFRSEDTVPHLESHLKHEVSHGKLKLFVELSREEFTLVTEKRVLKRRRTGKRYIDKLLQDEADLLRELAAPRDEGGMEASFYICGNSDFFKNVRMALEKIGEGFVTELVRSSRLHLEVQARGGRDGECNSRPLKLTETCFHNKLSDYWTIIDGKVYDFTEYLPWHPGGRQIMHYVAGTDCSKFWRLASHDRDRMVYSQISAYEVGPYDDSDPDGLMGFLEVETRCENCVELYMAKKDLFSNLCDSYDKIINIVESIFGEIFIEIVCRLVKDIAPRSRMLNRVYLTRKSDSKTMAKRLFSVAPKIKGLASQSQSNTSREIRLRPVSDIERTELQNRLIGSSKHFFSVSKQCIVAYCNSAEQNECNRQISLVRMFFTLVQSLENLFVSLSQPIPVPNLKLWEVVKAEVLCRKTFLLRFKPERSIPPDEVQTLTSRPFPETLKKQEAFLKEIMEAFALEAPGKIQDDEMMIGSRVIDDWYTQTEVRDLFKRLDTNGDSLVNRADILACVPQNDIENQMLESLKEELQHDQTIETYNFEEFLLCSPWLAEKKRMIKVSALLFKRMVMSSG